MYRLDNFGSILHYRRFYNVKRITAGLWPSHRKMYNIRHGCAKLDTHIFYLNVHCDVPTWLMLPMGSPLGYTYKTPRFYDREAWCESTRTLAGVCQEVSSRPERTGHILRRRSIITGYKRICNLGVLRKSR